MRLRDYLGRRVAHDLGVVMQLSREKRIRPPGHHEDWASHVSGAIVAVNRLPIRIAGRMIRPIVEETNFAGGAIVGLDQWEPVVAPIEIDVAGLDVIAAAAFDRPRERTL